MGLNHEMEHKTLRLPIEGQRAAVTRKYGNTTIYLLCDINLIWQY